MLWSYFVLLNAARFFHLQIHLNRMLRLTLDQCSLMQSILRIFLIFHIVIFSYEHQGAYSFDQVFSVHRSQYEAYTIKNNINCSFYLQINVLCSDSKWTIKRTYQDLIGLDRQLHRYLYVLCDIWSQFCTSICYRRLIQLYLWLDKAKINRKLAPSFCKLSFVPHTASLAANDVGSHFRLWNRMGHFIKCSCFYMPPSQI